MLNMVYTVASTLITDLSNIEFERTKEQERESKKINCPVFF